MKQPIIQEEKEFMKIKCKYCNYEWHTKSKMLYICCPYCKRLTRIRPFKKFKED